MPANNDPIYSRVPAIRSTQMESGYIVSANTTTDLTSGTTYKIFTADATNGSYVQKMRLRAVPASSGNTTATVARVWLNNGSSTGTATNNALIDEITLPQTTLQHTAATANYEIALNFPMPAGWVIYVTIGTASSSGWSATVFGGNY